EYKSSAWGVLRIGALACWGAYGARGNGVNVGLLDTGVDASHPDLKGRITNWAEFDSDGRIVVGSKPHDSDEHGTHCAGIIAGGNKSGQWIGVAPEATISAALVINGRRGGTDAQVLAGIQWAAEQGVDVINMSLGGVWFDPEVRDDYMNSFISCLRLGIPVVVAIGNSGHQTTGTPGNDFFAFSVGATDHEDRIAGFSGGRTHIIRDSNILPKEALPLVYSKPDVSAPGVAIKSCTPKGQWKSFNGTSMAAPHVSGAIALLLSVTSIRRDVERNQRAFLVQDLMISSVKEMGESGQDHRYGFGRIDVLRAIDFAQDLGY
ncbi:MAG: S8 family serine peptidase, partial [Anaerolineaceae bacterium]